MVARVDDPIGDGDAVRCRPLLETGRIAPEGGPIRQQRQHATETALDLLDVTRHVPRLDPLVRPGPRGKVVEQIVSIATATAWHGGIQRKRDPAEYRHEFA